MPSRFLNNGWKSKNYSSESEQYQRSISDNKSDEFDEDDLLNDQD